jgi:hypothetical protein
MKIEFICRNCKEKCERYFHINNPQPQFCSRLCRAQYSYKPSVIKKRFWSKVDIREEDECWLWKEGTNPNGYGHFHYFRGFNEHYEIVAHRFAYRILVGKIPKGMGVLHVCDQPLCVNPQHLFLGTPADNMKDKKSKDRQRKGSRVPNSKLTEKDIPVIRRLIKEGWSQPEIAVQFGVTPSLIWYIKHKKIWSHVL